MIKELKRRLADTIEATMTDYYLRRRKQSALSKTIEKDKKLAKLILSLEPEEQGIIAGTVDNIEKEATFKGFKAGFNLAQELMNQKPLFEEEWE